MTKFVSIDEAAKKFKRNFIRAYISIERTDDFIVIAYLTKKLDTVLVYHSINEVKEKFKADKISLAHFSYRNEFTNKEVDKESGFALFYND